MTELRDLQIQENILPNEVARKTNDTPEVIALIDKLNPTIKTAEELDAAVAQVDALRRKLGLL